MADVRQSGEYARWMETMGWRAEKILGGKSGETNFAYIRPLSLVGSVMKVLRPTEPVSFVEIERVAKKFRALFVKVEPNLSTDETYLREQFAGFGYKEEKWALVPSKTLKIDLTLKEEDLFGSFKKDCRYDIRKAEGLKFKLDINDFETFYEVLRKSNKRKGLWTFPKNQFDNLVKSFEKNTFCITSRGVAGCLVLTHDNTAYYFLAGSLSLGKEAHAPSLVIWEAMKEARRNGSLVWDFEGLEDKRIPSTKGWSGFSHFKRGFGGYEVEFPGTFTHYRNPLMKIFSPFG